MVIHQDDSITVSWEAADKVVVSEWRRKVSLAEMQAGFTKTLELIGQHQAPRWVNVWGEAFSADPDMANWLRKDLVAQLPQSGLKYLVTVVANLKLLAVPPQPQEKDGLTRYTCQNLEEALAWLKKQP